MDLPYTVGQRTKRAKIHEQFGGPPQYGISSSGQVDAIFLFTEDGGNNPYEDVWISETELEYSGQGKREDQTFNRSDPNGRVNDDLKNHAEYGKEVHLFEKSAEDDSIVVYLGQLEYVDHNCKQRKDVDGNPRQEIRFELRLVDSEYPDDEDVISDEETLRELAENASRTDSASIVEVGEVTGHRNSSVNTL